MKSGQGGLFCLWLKKKHQQECWRWYEIQNLINVSAWTTHWRIRNECEGLYMKISTYLRAGGSKVFLPNYSPVRSSPVPPEMRTVRVDMHLWKWQCFYTLPQTDELGIGEAHAQVICGLTYTYTCIYIILYRTVRFKVQIQCRVHWTKRYRNMKTGHISVCFLDYLVMSGCI